MKLVTLTSCSLKKRCFDSTTKRWCGSCRGSSGRRSASATSPSPASGWPTCWLNATVGKAPSPGKTDLRCSFKRLLLVGAFTSTCGLVQPGSSSRRWCENLREAAEWCPQKFSKLLSDRPNVFISFEQPQAWSTLYISPSRDFTWSHYELPWQPGTLTKKKRSERPLFI